jgi:hypothetical protein
MPFLVVGTPWKRPRSSRLCCPDCGDRWFGGISSTRTATLRMRVRNSCGSESSASSTALTKCSRFILYPLKQIKSTLTPSSRRLRRYHRHLLCPCLRLPLRLLPRLALIEGEHRQLPTDQKGLSRSILYVFCSCPMVRLVPFTNAGIPYAPVGGTPKLAWGKQPSIRPGPGFREARLWIVSVLPPARPESLDSLHTDEGVRVDTSTVNSVFGPKSMF